MARPLRIQYPGAFYHVIARGNEGTQIFETEGDRKRFLSYLESAHERYGALFHAYCLMGTHYHLLLETPHANLSRICHFINGAYTTYFNLRKERSGHLFQGRYQAILVEKDAYAQELSRYIHLNPLRAGLVSDPLDYAWSSYRCYIGTVTKPPWLVTDVILDYFTGEAKPQEQYRIFVMSATHMQGEGPLEQVVRSTFLGSKQFIETIKEQWIDAANTDIRNVPALRDREKRMTLEEIKNAVRSAAGIASPFYKTLCLYMSQQYGGYSLKEIGDYYGMNAPAVSQQNRRFKNRIIQDHDARRVLGQVTEAVKCQMLRPDPDERR